MRSIEEIVKEVRACGEQMIQLADELSKLCEKSEEAPKKEISLSDVRAVLAQKSRDGYTKEVKALLIKFGADKLSSIEPSKYEALLVEAEVIGNG